MNYRGQLLGVAILSFTIGVPAMVVSVFFLQPAIFVGMAGFPLAGMVLLRARNVGNLQMVGHVAVALLLMAGLALLSTLIPTWEPWVY